MPGMLGDFEESRVTDLPYMPLWVAEYRADTGHLSTVEHGAYLLLIMHYWQTKALPSEDPKLARIAGLTERDWRKIKPTINAFFLDGWKHKRVEEELLEAKEKHERRQRAGKAGGNAAAGGKQRGSNAGSNATAKPEQCPQHYPSSKSQSKSSEAKASGVPPDPKADYFKRGREVLGEKAGGLIAKVLKSQGSEDDVRAIAKARALIEQAFTKTAPAEWLGRVLNGAAQPVMANGEPYPEGII